MFGFINKMFIALLSFSGWLASIGNISNWTICISLNNQPCMTRSTLIDLNPDEYNQGLGYYTFTVKLDRCNGSFNTFDDPSGTICVANKTEGKCF